VHMVLAWEAWADWAIWVHYSKIQNSFRLFRYVYKFQTCQLASDAVMQQVVNYEGELVVMNET